VGTRQETDRQNDEGEAGGDPCRLTEDSEIYLVGDGGPPTFEHEGEVDPDELEIAVYLIEDAMAADMAFAIAAASVIGHHPDVKAFAAANPHLAISLADSATDFIADWDTALAKAMAKHGEAQRGLAEDAGYSRDVWHRPPAPPTEI
jgi:hypothetical protein